MLKKKETVISFQIKGIELNKKELLELFKDLIREFKFLELSERDWKKVSKGSWSIPRTATEAEKYGDATRCEGATNLLRLLKKRL